MPDDPGGWMKKAAALRPDGRALVGGHRSAAASGDSLPLLSPRDGEKLADVVECGEHDVDRAVALARRAADAGSWSRQQGKHRKDALARWAELLEGAREELAVLLALETGKPIRTALTVEMRSVVQSIRWYAEVADKLEGRHPQASPNAVALVEREPAGVVGVVLPWNFPLSMVGYDLAPALAIGNSVIVKPSELAPLSVLRACELAVEAGVPPDIISVLPGIGPVAGGALGRHHDVDVIAITGAPATGRAFLEYSARSNGKRVWPKLGGKSAVIICQDAPSLEVACRAAAWAAFFNQGAMCTGGSRILVEDGIVDEVTQRVAELTDALVVGDPLVWETDIGPLASPALLSTACDVVRDAVEKGGTIVRGGETLMDSGPLYFPPTLLAGLPPSSRLNTEEIFAPIAGIVPFNGFGAAIEKVNGLGMGMAVSIWTSSLRKAFDGSRAAKVGTCWVNCFEGDDLSVPFGGVKRSGYGKDKSWEALDKYSDLKTIWLQLDDCSYW